MGLTLSHPLVLKAAWMRVDDWYRRGNMAPEPELARWQLNPENRLRHLGSLLRDRKWTPSPWLQIPYPKKGARLRHYVLPTVQDQVAFMAHMVILGPVVDSQLHPFVFGNRWYRPILWDRSRKQPRWKHLPYPLLTAKSYLPYPRDHGLFRRVANWTVSRMTGTPVASPESDAANRLPTDYPKRGLPKWVRKAWWRRGTKCDRAHWAALDIELAYPSIRTAYLHKCLAYMFAHYKADNHRFRGYPSSVLKMIHNPGSLEAIGGSLVGALRRVVVPATNIPTESWRPPHARSHWNPEDLAVPTGLAISGVLLNVALHPTDIEILEYLEQRGAEERGAFLRFADDMYVFSRSTTGLLRLMEVVSRELADPKCLRLDPSRRSQGKSHEDDRHEGVPDSRILDLQPPSPSNLYLNLDKVRPNGVKNLLEAIRREAGWDECPSCEVQIPGASPRRPAALDRWWAANDQGENLSQHREALFRESVGPGEVGPFVTTLVERMSEIGWGSLRERFGEGARNRLQRLHELARFHIDDEQVAADTRGAFAVNRLVTAWLPTDDDGPSELRDIRRSVAEVLDRTPWKFALWTAVVRAAARRVAMAESQPGPRVDPNEAGARWLEEQLRRIAADGGSDDRKSWRDLWPESDIDQHQRGDGWREQYLSFVRASFWQGLRAVITELWSAMVITSTGGDAKRDGEPHRRGLSPDMWSYRAIPDGGYRGTLIMLSDTDRWIRVLYPELENTDDLSRRAWELDQLVAAVLSATPGSEAVSGWMHCPDPGNVLCVPDSLLHSYVETAMVLRRGGRVVSQSKRVDGLGPRALAHVRLAGRDRRLGVALFRRGEPRMRGWRRVPSAVVKCIRALECTREISAEAMDLRLDSPRELIRKIGGDPLYIEDYGAVRRVLVGCERGELRVGRTLHRLLWGVPDEGEDDGSWRLRPWEVPEVGLPVAVAVSLFDSVGKRSPESWEPAEGPHTWGIGRGWSCLTALRRYQFRGESDQTDRPAVQRTRRGNRKVRVRKSMDWEVSPHGAYFLPFLNSRPEDVDRGAYALYCDILLLLTALDGGEGILDAVQRSGAGNVGFQHRWDWRSRLHLGEEAWAAVDSVIRWSETPQAAPMLGSRRGPSAFRRALRESVAPGTPVATGEFGVERVDLHVDSPGALEFARVARRSEAVVSLPEKLTLDSDIETEELRVRIGQVLVDVCTPARKGLSAPARTRNRTMEQVFQAFLAPSYGREGQTPDLVVLPELTIPREEVVSVRKCVKETGVAALSGLYWRALAPVYSPTGKATTRNRWVVNEAELMIPVNSGGRGPTSVRTYRVRKPLPTHMEEGLMGALAASYGGSWRMLPGQRWYRFVHSRWGDFSVAICSDLIDAAPWRTLRGEILHLFVVAHNRDVDLYDALTWARAYENYANLVSVNAGDHGGSLVWTPRRKIGRELARIRGRELNVVADVEVPVRGLVRAQLSGVRDAVDRATREWCAPAGPTAEFKAPPPGYRRRAMRRGTPAVGEEEENEG